MSMVQHTGDSVSVKITAHDAFAVWDAASTSCYKSGTAMKRLRAIGPSLPETVKMQL
jgi:hypothetical protein